MKKIFRKIFIASTIMVATLAAGIFTSCAYDANQETIKREEGFNCCVTYDANGGSYGSNSYRTYALVQENSLAPAPGYVDAKTQASIKIPTRRDFQLVGEAKSDGDDETNDEAILTKSWFVAKTDDDGNVIYEGEGENKTAVLESETPWNFTKDKVTKDITLVAQWREVFRFTLCIMEEKANGDVVEVTEKELRQYTVEPGDTIVDKLYDKDKSTGTIVRRADYIKSGLSSAAYTVLDFYMDKECTELLDSSYQHPGRHEEEITEDGVTTTVSTNVVKIYAKYLAGKYDFISNKNVKTLNQASKWYLLEDIDYAAVETPWTVLSSFSGSIYGNGYTIKNLTVESVVKKPSGQYMAHSIFGRMNGIVENLTLENVTLKLRTEYGTTIPGNEHRAAFLAYSLGENAMMNNVTLNGCRILFADADCYTHVSADGGLWWETPADGKATVTGSVEIAETMAE